MNLIDLFAHWFKGKQRLEDINIRFGRYSDAYKPIEKHDCWIRSQELFSKQRHLEAYQEFFQYLLDEEFGNVLYEATENEVSFTIFQGSKVIRGLITKDDIRAEVQVVKSHKLDIAFARKLVEMNYGLLYGCFSLSEDQIIYLRFSSEVMDGYPGKLYNGLREIATVADEQDDLLLDEFNFLESIDDTHKTLIDIAEQSVKIKYYRKWLQHCIEAVDRFGNDEYAGASAYFYLNTAFKIDYLIVPEGPVFNAIDRIHSIYFENTDSIQDRNILIRKEINKMNALSDEDMHKNLYQTIRTFGLSRAPNDGEIALFIREKVSAIDWYIKHNYRMVAEEVLQYIAVYCLYRFGLPTFLQRLLHGYIRITNEDFFSELGSKLSFKNQENGVDGFDEDAVTTYFQLIIEEAEKLHPDLGFALEKLTFKNNLAFGISFYQQILNLPSGIY